MFRWKVLLQSYVSGEICSQRQRVCEAAQPPQHSAVYGLCVASPLSWAYFNYMARPACRRPNPGI